MPSERKPNIQELLTARAFCECGEARAMCGMMALCPKCDELALEFYKRNQGTMRTHLMAYLEGEIAACKQSNPQRAGVLQFYLEMERELERVEAGNG